MNEKEKTSDITKDGWIEIGFQSRITSLDERLISAHLGCKFEEVTTLGVTLPLYKQTICRVVLEEFLVDRGYITVGRYSWGETRSIFVYETIEIDVDKSKDIPDYGYLFLRHGSLNPIIVEVQSYGQGNYRISVFWEASKKFSGVKFIESLMTYASEHNILRGKIITSHMKFVKVSSLHRWDSVILPADITKEIRDNIELLINNVEVYRKNNLVFKRGLILKGVPGTGKTMILKTICNELKGTTVIWVTPGDLRDVNEVKQLGNMARELSPSILMLEDLDLYGGHRELGNRAILGELMNQLDGLVENEFVIVIATTNRADEVEEALRNRPGRFDKVIDIAPPDKECRIRMLDSFLVPTIEVTRREELIEALSELTEGLTGAHIKELVNLAVISAIDEKSLSENQVPQLKAKHFKRNIKNVRGKDIKPTGFHSDSSEPIRPRTIMDDIFNDD